MWIDDISNVFIIIFDFGYYTNMVFSINLSKLIVQQNRVFPNYNILSIWHIRIIKGGHRVMTAGSPDYGIVLRAV